MLRGIIRGAPLVQRSHVSKRPRSVSAVAFNDTLATIEVAGPMTNDVLDVHGVPFDKSMIGNAIDVFEWLKGHHLARYHDGLFALIGFFMIWEGIDREAAYRRKRYLISKAKREDLLTPLAKYEGVKGATDEIFIEWNDFRTLWLPLLKGPLANLYRAKVLHTGENARAGDERVVLETLQNREARLNASEETRTVIEEGVTIVDELATEAGLPVLRPPPYETPQLTYEQQKRLLYHQHNIQKEENATEERKRKQRLDALAEESHQLSVRSKDSGLLEQLNAEKHRTRRLEAKNDQLEIRNGKLIEKAEQLQQKVDDLQRSLIGCLANSCL